MSVRRISCLLMLSILGTLALTLTGCGFSGGGSTAGTGSGSLGSGLPAATSTLGGKIFGGQQPISGATVTLWAAGTTGTYGSGATAVATTTTDAHGSFGFSSGGVSPCTTGQYLYITSVGGNSGGGINPFAAVMAALPAPCGPATASSFVVVNEVTTVATVTALQQFMSITPGGSTPWIIGTPAANVTGMANAFLQVGNLVGTITGLSAPSTATSRVGLAVYSTTITPDSAKINTLANILAACINTAGSSVCNTLFADTTPLNSTSPTDTIQAAYYLATNPAGLTMPAHGDPGSPSYLCSQYVGATPPFPTTTPCNTNPTGTYPTDWTVDVSWSTSNGTTPVGTQTAASVAIDASGNIWTAALNTSTTGLGVTEFNPAGLVQFTPATTAAVAGGWNFSTCGTCSTAANLGGTKSGDSIAIDTNGNAWAGAYNGTEYTVGSQPEGVVVRVTPGTGAASAYLMGSFPSGVALDGNNNLYVGDDSSTTTNRWYEAELLATGSTPYSTFETGAGRTGGNGDFYIGASVDETANQYVWPWSTPCQSTIPRTTNVPSPGTITSVVGSTTNLPSPACYIATDASGNGWVTSNPGVTAGGKALEYVNVAASVASPNVTTFTQGANGLPTGSELGGGLFNPQGLTLDGTGNLWVVNQNGSAGGGISEFVPSNNGTTLTPMSPSGTGVWGFFSNSTIGTPIGAAIDGSGNIWFKTKTGSSLYYLVGAASPVVTPLSLMVKSGFLAERPGATLLASLTPALNYSTVLSTGQPQTATLTNTGTAAMKINSVTISGTNASDFAVTGNTCGTSLAVGLNCAITVTFTSSTPGTFTGALNVNSNAVISPAAASLTGTADTSVGLSLGAGTSTPPTVPSITFASMVAGGVSTGQAVVVTNTGAVPLSLTIGMSGAGANLFPQTTSCGVSLAAGASCEVAVMFAPKVAGTYSAAILLTDNAGSGTQSIPVSGVATPFVITINSTSTTNWIIDNGAITFNWAPATGNLTSWVLDGKTDQLVDTTTTTNGAPNGLYMDNTGTFGSGTPTPGCTLVSGAVTVVGTPTTACSTASGSTGYLDWSATIPSNGTTDTYTFTEHWVVFPNDPGVHTYVELTHKPTDLLANVGQMQWLFRDSLSIFTNTYEVNTGLNYLGVQNIPQPSVADTSNTDPGRVVSNAVEDLHGFNDLPTGFTREFYTKYDYEGYEVLHQGHGVYGTASSGTTYGIWTVVPNLDTFSGGPTKQDLFFTNNIDMGEIYSDHNDEPINLNTAAGVAFNRLFGPIYYHVNTVGTAYNQTGNTIATPADMYADALSAGANFSPLYDNIAPLAASGYVASTARGSVSLQISGVAGAARTAWAVLSDPATNFEVSCNGYQYWADISTNGTATITGVVPGTYRLSVYVLGQWGEMRQENIVVTANNTTVVPATAFVPENFGGTATPVFTIGTPDRSAHEFLHGSTANGNEDREFDAAWNYWADFASTGGAVVYYATAVGGTPATNDLTKWNYVHWGSSFDPGLFAGVFNPSDDTTDGYIYTIPAYVNTLPGHSGTNGVTTGIPSWQVHFATPANFASEAFVTLSVAVACQEGSYVLNLNNTQQFVFSRATPNESDCMVRSGLSGYTLWFVTQWPTSALTQTVGGDNVITIGMSQAEGSSDDALRLELTNTSADPAVTGWHDYSFMTNGTTTANNDAVPNP
jgi:rhamnogalacturonan endolyase